MSQNNITLHIINHTTLTLPQGTTGTALLQKLNLPSQNHILALQIDNTLQHLDQPINNNADIQLITWEHPKGKNILWNATAQLLAAAIHDLYPNAKTASGQSTEQGFYYDIDFGNLKFDATHLPAIKKKIQQLINKKIPYTHLKTAKRTALTHQQLQDNPYKNTRLQSTTQDPINLCQLHTHLDITNLPLPPNTACIKAFKLTNIAGAYWQANVQNKQLTRISGISFPNKELLKQHLQYQEEAIKRDHRKIGSQLQLFTFSQHLGLGLPLWLPKGAFLRQQLIDNLTKQLTNVGYQLISTPHIAHKNLYITSGHYNKYSENTFKPIHTPSNETFLLKPMNCPHHCLIYKDQPQSYKNLPLRLAEFGTVYRYEQHGELHGLTRTRCFTQDDGHSFCMPEHIQQELITNIQLTIALFKKMGFDNYTAQISLRDPNKLNDYIGSPQDWHLAEQALLQATKHCNLTTHTLYGEAAFYGPKIDFMVKDALQRSWQLGTIQLDYQLPQRFQLTYTTSQNTQATPIIIHRAALGSLERFIAILLEHTAGHLPPWLCMHQVAILPLATDHIPYAQDIATKLQHHGIRTTIDERTEKINRKLRDAITQKIPYMLIIGTKEVQQKTITIRQHSQDTQQHMTLDTFIAQFHTLHNQ